MVPRPLTWTLQLSRFIGRTEVRIAISRTAMIGDG